MSFQSQWCSCTRKVFSRHSTLIIHTCCSRLLAVTDRRGTDCSEAQTLSSLLASSITGLVWMPNLLTVIAELCSTAFSSTCKFGTAGTSKCNHGISWTIKRGKRVLLTEVFFIYRSKLKRAARAAEAARKAVDTRSWHHAATTVPYHLSLSHAYCYYGRLRLHRNTPINTTLLCPTFNGFRWYWKYWQHWMQYLEV